MDQLTESSIVFTSVAGDARGNVKHSLQVERRYQRRLCGEDRRDWSEKMKVIRTTELDQLQQLRYEDTVRTNPWSTQSKGRMPTHPITSPHSAMTRSTQCGCQPLRRHSATYPGARRRPWTI